MPDLKADKFKKMADLSSEDRAFWNSYIDHLEKKGLKGSPKMDAADLSRAEFEAYTRQTGKPYAYESFIPSVQNSIISYRNKAIDQIKSGKASWPGYKGDGNFDGFMPNLSALDGLAGQYTTNYRFPSEVIPVMNMQTGVQDRTTTNSTYLDANKYKKTGSK
jgi:hypothetical protein